MIRRYNLSQTTKALLLSLGGIICCGITGWLLASSFHHLATEVGYPQPPAIAACVAVVGLAIISYLVWRRWAADEGLHGHHPAQRYYRSRDEDLSGEVAFDPIGFALFWGLLVIFTGGPLLLLRASSLLQSRISDSPDLEFRLTDTLRRLRTANKWQSLNEYPECQREILYLAQMELIDFSTYKHPARFKVRDEPAHP